MDRVRERILVELLGAPKRRLSVWELSRRCGYLSDVLYAAEALARSGVLTLDASTASLRKNVQLPSYLSRKPPAMGTIMRRWMRMRQSVSFCEDQYDQLAILPEGIERKLKLCLDSDDLRERRVLCIGDDDLFSVACALTRMPKRVTVFDIDEKVIDFLSREALRLPIPLQVRKMNILQPLPKKYLGAFDIVATEPPDTVAGSLLFLDRSLACLRSGGVLYFGLTLQTLKERQWRRIEERLLRTGAVLTDIIRCAEPYETVLDELKWRGFEKLPAWVSRSAEAPWFVAALFRAVLVEKKKTPRIAERGLHQDLLTSLLP